MGHCCFSLKPSRATLEATAFLWHALHPVPCAAFPSGAPNDLKVLQPREILAPSYLIWSVQQSKSDRNPQTLPIKRFSLAWADIWRDLHRDVKVIKKNNQQECPLEIKTKIGWFKNRSWHETVFFSKGQLTYHIDLGKSPGTERLRVITCHLHSCLKEPAWHQHLLSNSSLSSSPGKQHQ